MTVAITVTTAINGLLLWMRVVGGVESVSNEQRKRVWTGAAETSCAAIVSALLDVTTVRFGVNAGV